MVFGIKSHSLTYRRVGAAVSSYCSVIAAVSRTEHRLLLLEISFCLRCADLIKMQSPVLFLQLLCTPVDVLFMRIPKCDFNYSVYVYCKHL